MRIIDADALKKCAIPCQIHNGALTELCVPVYQIDNAPTVELTETEIQDVLNKRCMTAVTNEYLIALHGKRPQENTGLYREESCDRKYGCYDYEHWHCIGCNGCKKGGAE